MSWRHSFPRTTTEELISEKNTKNNDVFTHKSKKILASGGSKQRAFPEGFPSGSSYAESVLPSGGSCGELTSGGSCQTGSDHPCKGGSAALVTHDTIMT